MSKSVREERLELFRKILTFLSTRKDPFTHSTEVAKGIGISNDRAFYRLKSLAIEGLVHMERTSYGVILWQITDEGREWLKEQH